MSKLDLNVWKSKPSGGQSSGVETPISYPSDFAGSGSSSQSKKNEQYVEEDLAEASSQTTTQDDEQEQSEVKLSEGEFIQGENGFGFLYDCKIKVKVEYKKGNSSKFVKFKLFSKYNDQEFDHQYQVEGTEKDGYSEATVPKLFYDENYYNDASKPPDAKCYYFFKASHPECKEEHVSEDLEMPYAVMIDGKVQILEMEDVLFNSDSAVLLPDKPVTDEDDLQQKVDGLEMIKAVYNFYKENSEKKLLIIGHTDSTDDNSHNIVLSRTRARSVYYLLTGEREKWVETVESRNKDSLQKKEYRNQDIRQVLTWIHSNYDLTLEDDPDDDGEFNKTDGSSIDGDRETRKAIRRFRKWYQKNSEGDKPIFTNSYNAPGNGDEYWGWAYKKEESGWGAVFDVYQYYLATNLINEIETVSDLHKHFCAEIAKALDWSNIHDKKADMKDLPYTAIGCGEERPIEGFDAEWKPKDDLESQKNRRVIALFFDPEEAKKITEIPSFTNGFPCFDKDDNPCDYCNPKDGKDPCPIYGKDENGKFWFVPEYLEVEDEESEPQKGMVWISLYSPLYYPIAKISCRLICEDEVIAEQISSEQGELFWEEVSFTSDLTLELCLDDRTISFLVPWLKEKTVRHEIYTRNAKELFGSLDSSYGIQGRLTGLGYDCGKIDGIIGDLTRKAVESFQHDQGIKCDRDPGPITQSFLYERYGA